MLNASDSAGDPAWLRRTREAMANAPVPEQATGLAERLLATRLPGDERPIATRLTEMSDERAEKLSHILYALCGVAPFFIPFFCRHPNWLFELLESDLSRPRREDELMQRLDTALAQCSGDDRARVLREFKYFELARLTIRDCCQQWVPISESEVTLREISRLADLILARSLAAASEQIRQQIGPPRWRTAEGEEVDLSFCVLGLGKLGSEELNYSSDVDLIYLCQTSPGPLSPATDSGQLSPNDYFTRLAQAFGKLVSDATSDGFLYRIDLDLRPEGAQGSLVVSTEALASYYESRADTWERAAFMKARPVAGDFDLGWRAIRQVDPMIYRHSMDYAGVESIRSLKRKVGEAHGGHGGEFNVKIDAGGIRDVEFIAQALQLLHGGRIRQLRERSTQRALRKLAEVGLFAQEHVEDLLDAYRFLRRTENRIQMEGEQQRHVVPREGTAFARLARAMGFLSADAATRFEEELETKRQTILALFGGSFAEGGKERIFELFTRNVPHLARLTSTRSMLETLAEQFAMNIDNSPDPERCLNNLDRFIQGVGSRRFYYELLLDRPELVPRLTALFAASKYLSSYLAANPRLIEPVFADPNTLLLSRAALKADLSATLAEADGAGGDAYELALDGVRIFQRRQLLNVGLLDIAEKISRAEAEGSLTEIAEVCLENAFEVAQRRLATRPAGVPEAAGRGAYLIVGMGKLGSRELSYGSDLDLIFLYDLREEDAAAGPAAQEYFVSLTQRLISHLQTPTSTGSCYEIDARLRPSGNQGTLVTSLSAFRRYHESSAAVWERQALLRARPVAGDRELAAAFAEVRLEILSRPLPEDLASEIDSIRQRMESELARETQVRRNFKTGRGGLLDIETTVQYLRLRHRHEHPGLLSVRRLEEHIDRLARAGLLAAEAAATLRDGWQFLQRLSNRLRIVENRSISDLDSDRGDLDGLARRLAYEATGREGGARRALLMDYEHHTGAIRAVYESILRTHQP